MARRVAAWLCCSMAAVATAAAAPISLIVSSVQEAIYTGYLNNQLYTHLGDNRGYGAQHNLARTNIFDTFSSFGLSTSLEWFNYGEPSYANVVGRLTGTKLPNEIVIVGAHYDSVNNPGADDNASGVAGVLEAARVLSQYSFGRTLVFVAFDREEQGLYGSRAYVAAHSTDRIIGMVSLDMIAFDSPNPGKAARVYANANPTAWDAAVQQALWDYGSISSTFGTQLDYSDHAPFRQAHIPAALVIEADWQANPYYHKSTDSVDTSGYIDYAFATSITRGVTGFLAMEADVPEPAAALLAAVALLSMIRVRRRLPD